MRSEFRERLVPLIALGAALAAIPGALNHFVGGQKVYIGGPVHFWAVGVTALAAAICASALTLIGTQRRDCRAVLVGTAFAVMAALLALHGLATPGMLVGQNGVIAFTGGATLPVGGAILALTALPRLSRPDGIRPLLALQVALLLGVFALGASALAWPGLMPSVPEPNSPAALTTLAIGLAFYLLLGLRAFRTYLLTRRGTDLAVVVGIAWLATALVPALTMSYLELGWWLGHWFELAGIAIVGATVAIDLVRSAQSRPLAGNLRAPELVAAEEAFLGSRVRALTMRLAEKDEYTEGHTRRVALRAVQIGEELGLSPSRLRTLAIGGLLHDVGKLSVPDSILKKPGALDDAEYAVVQRHADWGERLLHELGGFSEGVKRLVRDHHERLDGSGYPRGLRGNQLATDVRILAVCDVYDALISPRVYRPAWTHARAIALLQEESGTLFDSHCVSALERVLTRERLTEPVPAPVNRPVIATT
jgi:HD-GYP domain-containing protein (c-di-GMP phosphodiesterase class II)